MKTNLKSPIFACAMLAALAMLAPSVSAYGQFRLQLNIFGKNKLSYNPPIFPQEYKAAITKLNDDLVTTMPNYIMLCDSVAVLAAGSAENDKHFQVVSLKDGKFKSAFGYVGRGPKELTSYSTLDFDSKRNLIFAIDDDGKCLTIDLKRALLRQNDFVSDCWKMPSFARCLLAYHLGDKLLQVECSPCSRFFTTATNGQDTLNRYDVYPSITKFLDQNKYCKSDYYFVGSKYAIRPDRKKLVNITGGGMIMEIFDIADGRVSGKLVRRFYRPMPDESDREFYISSNDEIIGNTQTFATDKYIYACYYDTSEDSFEKAPMPYLGIFDWQGQEICRYTFEQQRIRKFAITPDDKRCYCWVMNPDGEEYLGYFDLK